MAASSAAYCRASFSPPHPAARRPNIATGKRFLRERIISLLLFRVRDGAGNGRGRLLVEDLGDRLRPHAAFVEHGQALRAGAYCDLVGVGLQAAALNGITMVFVRFP